MNGHSDAGNLGVIGVLMGGYSSERDISLKSGKAVVDALKEAGCRATAIDIISTDEKDILALVKSEKIDVAFIALHGRLGEDGTIQMILENADIPYTGSGVRASRLAMDKIAAYKKFEEVGLPCPKHIVFRSGGRFDINAVEAAVSLPLVVKPASEGSSIGVTIVRDKADISGAVEAALKYGPEILVEQCIQGRELTVGVLGENALPVVEIRPRDSFFDFTAKYQHGMTDYLVPAPLADSIASKVQDMGLEAHRVLECEDFSRVDFMLDKDENPYILEVNTIPGFTSTSLLPKAAKAAGIDFSQLCLKIMAMAYGKTQKQKQK